MIWRRTKIEENLEEYKRMKRMVKRYYERVLRE